MNIFNKVDTELSTVGWNNVNWHEVTREVRQMQRRIVKAIKQGRMGRAKGLERLLVNSTAAKLLAVRQVVTNRGKGTPGIDGVLWKSPAAKYKAAMSLNSKDYKALPLKRVYIPKGNGKRRGLGIPTMQDRAMQALYALALSAIAETLADPNSYGFRKERSVADAIAQCFNVLSKKNQAVWIFEGDIKGCYDHINHEWVLEHVPLPPKVLEQWLKSGVLEGGKFQETTEGTPQGGIISPVIANLVLDGLESGLNAVFGRTRREKRLFKVYLIRYADDFIITAASKELLETQVKPLVMEFLAQRGLELNEEKSRISHIDEGFDFLGFHLRKYAGKLIITPSDNSVKHILTKIRTLVKKHCMAKSSTLIEILNPVIRGWGNFYRHVVSKKIFSAIDNAIWRSLWYWACRRHRNKSHKWVRAKYFDSEKGTWDFYDKKSGKKLLKMSSIAIKRHQKIKAEVNPYDPRWELYLEQRQQRRASWVLVSKERYTLWKRQEGKCPWCGGKLRLDIDRQTRFHVHHVVYKSQGGSDALKNKQLLHDVCHRQLHALHDSDGAIAGHVEDMAYDGLSCMR